MENEEDTGSDDGGGGDDGVCRAGGFTRMEGGETERPLKVCVDTSGRQLEPREPGRQLEQQLQELHGGQSEQQQPRQPQQQSRLPPCGLPAL